MLYLQVQKRLGKFKDENAALRGVPPAKGSESGGGGGRGCKRSRGPKSVLLHSLEQSVGLDGHSGPEGHFSASMH